MHTPKFLVMVTSQNNNKYYKLIPQGDRFTVEFGRVGGGSQTASYPISQWDKKYNEKIRKGYVDRTDLIEELITKEDDTKSNGYKEIENKVIADIVDRLQSMAKEAVAANYKVSSNKVTMAMVDEAQKVLASLMECDTVEEFNASLLNLFGVIPRKMSNVASYIAKENAEFGSIIKREQDLLDVMRGQVYERPPVINNESVCDVQNRTILEEKGLRLDEVTPSDIERIKKTLGSCADKYHRAWRVTNIQTQKAFDTYTTQGGGIATKLLWHGSRNENWWSIVNSGLVLRPTNAVITGKMFGFGIYFATKARKSLGYTSLTGSYWAKGSSSSAFMGLYDVAYGKPYDVYSFDSKYYKLDYGTLQSMCPGANSLHAHEGTMLKNDEIIVYNECQTTIRYLVELK